MRTVFAFCFLGLLALLGGVGVHAGFVKCQKVQRLYAMMGAHAPTAISFKQLYPFEGGTGNLAPERHGNEEACAQKEWIAAFQMYSKLVKRWTTGIKMNTMVHNALYDSFRRMIGLYGDMVGIDLEVSDDIFRLENGYYTFLFPYSESSSLWNNMRDIASWLATRNIRCLHLLPPYKFDDRVTVFPKGIPHGYGQMVREYRRFMANNCIPCLDATELLLAENPNFYDWFYKMYIHYTARAGLAIAQATARMLNEDLGVAADSESVRAENFTRCVYPKRYYANCAVGRDAGGEDVEALYPIKDGRFHVEVPSHGLDRTGGFSETIVLQTALESATRSHHAFLYQGAPLVRVENLTCTNGTRVLVVRRCDASVICAYLACAVRHLDVIYTAAFDGSWRAFIEKTKPDVVIFSGYMQTYTDDPFWRWK